LFIFIISHHENKILHRFHINSAEEQTMKS